MVPSPIFAQGYAAHAHRKQLYGKLPYMTHIGDVVNIVRGVKSVSGHVLEAAWLHDILEDTNTTKIELGAVFDSFVVDWVWRVTGTGGSRKQRNAAIYSKCKYYTQPTIIKLADRISNITHAFEHKQKSYIKMYLKEADEFWHGMRDDSMVDVRPLWDTYEQLIDKVKNG